MKKTLLYFVAVILLCGVTASCSKSGSDPKDTTVNKTIFVFMPYADNLTTRGYLSIDLSEMKQAIKANGNMNGYRVLVYYGSSSSITGGSSVLYEMKLQDGVVLNDTLREFSSVTQSDLQHLTNVFSLVNTLAPAKSHSLIVGGHGSGWTPSDISWGSISQYKAVSEQNKAPRKSLGGSLNQYDRIEVTTLSNAMTAASFHTDLLVFDCCFMDNIETLYDIRNNTDYVIASAAEQAGDGMPYNKIWNDIIGTMSRDKVSSILSSSLTYYDTNNTGYYAKGNSSTYLNPLTLAGIECSHLNNVAAAMANLNMKYGECTTDLTNEIQRFDKKDTGIYFDLLDYAKYQVGGNTQDEKYKSVESAVKDAVISTACRNWYLVILDNWGGPNCWPANTFCGIATSDPTTNDKVADKKKTTNWWKDTH